MTIDAVRRAEDDEQFRRKAEPSIVLNEVGHDGGSVSVPTPSAGQKWSPSGVGRGRALANGTRGEEDLRTTVGSLGFARTGSDSSHAP